VGYENWLVVLGKFYPGTNQQVCHNIFIQCASELGYMGLAVFIFMIAFTFINNSQTRRLASQIATKNQFFFYMAHGLDGALVGYLVSGFFVTVLYYPYFWINLAMTVSLREVAKKWSASHPTNNKTSRICGSSTP
jgi:O-antigen ligase